MIVRPVEPSDRDEWVRMRTVLFPDSEPREIDEWFENPDDSDEGLAIAVFVIDRGDGTLGGFIEVSIRNYAEGCATSPVAFLEGWYVDPRIRRRGLGRKLIEAAENWAKQQGLHEIASDTEIENTASERAHLALGYREVERHICFMKLLRNA